MTRTGDHTKDKYNDYFKILRGQFDVAIRLSWEEDEALGMKVSTFLRANLDVLSLFMLRADLLKIAEARGNFQNVPDEVVRCMESSESGVALVKKQHVKVCRVLFRRDLKTKLQILLNDGFQQ